MARHVFFSFGYDDVKNFKVNVVRNNWLLKNSEDTFRDGSIWEKSKTKGARNIKSLIENGLNNTSVTTVLIGENTANRRWVNYEIIKSFDRGNGIVGIHINRIKGTVGLTKKGLNPLSRLGFKISKKGDKIIFYELKSRKWVKYEDLPQINNKKSNTLFFKNHWIWGNEFGKFYRFSDKFNTVCWKKDNGNQNISKWIEMAFHQAK